MSKSSSSSWLYFGFDKSVMRRFSPLLAQSNLRALQRYCLFFVLFLLVIMTTKVLNIDWSMLNALPYLIAIALSLLLILAVQRNWFAKLSVVNRSRLLTSTLTVVVYALAIFYEILYPHNEIHVMICLAFITLDSMFDGYPLETMSMTAGALTVIGVLDWIFGTPGYFSQNMINSVAAATIGCYLAWQRTHDKVLLLLQQERESALRDKETRTQLMLSQIRPHFLYNVLATIQALCASDPKKASEAVGWLCDVLRGNMDAIGTTKMIPFRQELEHLQNYIQLEQLRFGEKLHVEYDLGATDFKIPSLTIQPIVENAVKHDVGNKRGGGTITIASREKQNIVVLTVSDDGAGVDAPSLQAIPPQNDGRSHVGLHNVEERIRLIANGSLSFFSKPGSGTVVTICLPKQETP